MPKKKRTNKVKKPIERLSTWKWTTLVGAWRYYENRGTIAGASFPSEIVERFFTGKYSHDVQHLIAHQFAETDHGLDGEKYWASDISNKSIFSNAEPWTTFYRFCEGFVKGWHKVEVNSGKKAEIVNAFHVDALGKWFPVEEYLKHPYNPPYIREDAIVKVDGIEYKKEGAKNGR